MLPQIDSFWGKNRFQSIDFTFLAIYAIFITVEERTVPAATSMVEIADPLLTDLVREEIMKDIDEEPWFVPENIQQAQWMNLVNNAAIPGQAKEFCRYIASKATWNHSKRDTKKYQPCYATQDTIEIQMGRSTDYVTKAKQAAVYYGWVIVKHRPGTSDYIYPAIGLENEELRVKYDAKKRDSSQWVTSELFPGGHPAMQS